MSLPLRAPFPYYGSKIAAAPLIERLMGPIVNLVVPFAGSLGELLGRSSPAKVETVNDLDGLVVNVWRALRHSPEAMAERCDRPVHEVTLHAAHDLLVERADELRALLESHPEAHDVELAAWWVWGRSCWLGGGWCDVRPESWRSRPQLSHAGQGVTKRQLPVLRGSDGTGVGYGLGVHNSSHRDALVERFAALAKRLRWVRITCGDWRRVVTAAVTTSHGLTGVSLDPPYAHDRRSGRLYREDDASISDDVRAWCVEHGRDPRLRIVIAGKGDEHDELLALDWSRHEWRADGEVLWASPGCSLDGPLFDRFDRWAAA